MSALGQVQKLGNWVFYMFLDHGSRHVPSPLVGKKLEFLDTKGSPLIEKN